MAFSNEQALLMALHADYEGLLAALLAVANGQIPDGSPSLEELVKQGLATSPPPALTEAGARELVLLLRAKYDLDPEADSEPSEDMDPKSPTL
jgi:hypothetical protein